MHLQGGITIFIITISGKAGSGKDTFANYLKEYLEKADKNVLIAHFADNLKFVAKTFHGWNGEKDEDGRKLLQHLGTDIYRESNKYFWVKEFDYHLKMHRKYINKYGGKPYDYIIIPDTRFPNEITYFKERYIGVVSINIARDGYDLGELSNHSSENALKDYDFDFDINTGKTLSEAEITAYIIGEKLLNYAQKGVY